jgi:hypothetical protein
MFRFAYDSFTNHLYATNNINFTYCFVMLEPRHTITHRYGAMVMQLLKVQSKRS